MRNKKVVFSTEWFFIEEEFFPKLSTLGGKPIYRMVESDAVCVLAVTAEQKIILVRQFRPVIGEYTLELPAGHIDEKENAITAAKRELYEETGYICDKWFCLASNMLMLASRSTMQNDLFLASGAVRDVSFEPKENIEVRLATLSEFKSLIMNGECHQNMAAGAMQLAVWHGLIPADF